MNRIEIINGLIKKNNYKSYLEIGVQNGHCFNSIECENKIGVDPDQGSAATIHDTSDNFFKTNKKKFDIIFIDGLHHADQVEKDIINSLKCLKKEGTIVMHDCLPTTKRMQEIPLQEQNEWTGDTWRAYLKLKEGSDLEMCVVNCDWGCGIIRRGKLECVLLSDINITFEEFFINKDKLMNVITPDQFKEKYL